MEYSACGTSAADALTLTTSNIRGKEKFVNNDNFWWGALRDPSTPSAVPPSISSIFLAPPFQHFFSVVSALWVFRLSLPFVSTFLPSFLLPLSPFILPPPAHHRPLPLSLHVFVGPTLFQARSHAKLFFWWSWNLIFDKMMPVRRTSISEIAVRRNLSKFGVRKVGWDYIFIRLGWEFPTNLGVMFTKW